MRYTVVGFSQTVAFNLDLDGNDLILLRWFVDFKDSGRMHVIVEDGEKYYWIHHKKLSEEMPILRMQKTAIYRRLKKLCNAGVLKKKIVNNLGTYTYYAMGPNYADLVSYQTRYKMPKSDVVAPVLMGDFAPAAATVSSSMVSCDFAAPPTCYSMPSACYCNNCQQSCPQKNQYNKSNPSTINSNSDISDSISGESEISPTSFKSLLGTSEFDSSTFIADTCSLTVANETAYKSATDSFGAKIDSAESTSDSFESPAGYFDYTAGSYKSNSSAIESIGSSFKSNTGSSESIAGSSQSAPSSYESTPGSFKSDASDFKSEPVAFEANAGAFESTQIINLPYSSINAPCNNFDKSDLNSEDKDTSPESMLSYVLWHFIRKINPNFKKPDFKDWKKGFRSILKKDGHHYMEVTNVMRWVFNEDESLASSIVNPWSLRKQYDKLLAKKSYIENLVKSRSTGLNSDFFGSCNLSAYADL